MRLPTRQRSVFLFLTAILALASVSAHSAILIVTNTQDNGADSLRGTVAAASAGDTIQFNISRSDPGYDPSTGVFTITLTSGEIVIDKDLTIAVRSGANIALSGNHASRIFHITTGTVAISDLTFVNGRARGANGYPLPPGLGGAILNQGSLVCARCTFTDNSAEGNPGSVYGCIQNDPGGDAQGGAIANEGTLSLVACTLAGNSAIGGDGGISPPGCLPQDPQGAGGKGMGGAIWNGGATSVVTLTNCTITGNSARSGDVPRPTADALGGGIANFGNLIVVRSTVANNMTVGGYDGTPSVGGGASLGGGLYCAVDSAAQLRDTILAGNVTVGANPGGVAAGPDVAGAISSQGHTLLGRSDGCTGFTNADLQGGATNETRLDPKLGALGYYGGTTQTLLLLLDSPAINSGSTTASARDQRYFVRTGPPDIGAFEYQGTQPTLLANISTRLRFQTGNNAMIGGFIITGTEPKTEIVRGIGPSLAVPGALADPVIEVHGPSGQILGSNDNWRDAGTRQQIIGSGLEPSNDLESALWGIIEPGAYTVIVRGNNDGTGIGLFEVYDLDQTVESKLANVSTRGFVGNGDDVMIVGAIVVGTAPRVLFRACGPTLADVGVPNALGDPLLQLYDGNGGLVAANYDWRDDQEAEIIATGIPPSNDLESAIVRDLVPGPYTAIMRDANDTPGNGRIEAYSLN